MLGGGNGNATSATGSFDPFSMFAGNAGVGGSPGGSLRSTHRVAYKMDMGLDEQHEWEEQEMLKEVDFKRCHIDPAPFQLVEKSSLLKVGVNTFDITLFTQTLDYIIL